MEVFDRMRTVKDKVEEVPERDEVVESAVRVRKMASIRGVGGVDVDVDGIERRAGGPAKVAKKRLLSLVCPGVLVQENISRVDLARRGEFDQGWAVVGGTRERMHNVHHRLICLKGAQSEPLSQCPRSN
jgi:hypothetical protein